MLSVLWKGGLGEWVVGGELGWVGDMILMSADWEGGMGLLLLGDLLSI